MSSEVKKKIYVRVKKYIHIHIFYPRLVFISLGQESLLHIGKKILHQKVRDVIRSTIFYLTGEETTRRVDAIYQDILGISHPHVFRNLHVCVS